MESVGWVDIALLIVLAASVVVGLVRGLVFEVMSLLGWLAAWVAAQWLAPSVAPHLPFGEEGAPTRYAAAIALTFVVALIVWTLLARLIRLLVHATPLSLVDRLLGAMFGLLRGALLLLVVTTLVSLSPWAASPAWQASAGAAWLQSALAEIRPLLPESFSRHLPA
jgi:membrane protein required for colicin V production